METLKDCNTIVETLKDCNTCVDGDGLSERCINCGRISSVLSPYPLWRDKDLVGFNIPFFLKDDPEEVDIVNKPPHYRNHPSGVECIQITEHMNFCLGNAMKYIWRAGDKHETPLEDLKKAKWYIEREIQRLEKNEEI